MNRIPPFLRLFLIVLQSLWISAIMPASANIPGGGTGTGANITLTSTSTTATMSNGIVSISMTKSSGQITAINYTFNNTGANQTLNLLSGNPNGGKLYWEHSNNQGMVFTYAVVVDPATNGGDYAEISLYSTTQANMPFAVHYSMRRGSPGFYVTAIWTHDSTNGDFGMGECRNNIYAGSIFNWMSVDATRNKLMQVSGGTSVGVPTAPGAVTTRSPWRCSTPASSATSGVRITVLDRSALEQRTCECYAVVKRETDRLLPYATTPASLSMG